MSRTIAIAAAALLFVFAPGAQAQTAKWDQAAVTAAAAESVAVGSHCEPK